MSLPKLETPTYKTKIPSTDKLIEFRPFLVKEEKLLLMASEGKNKDSNEIAKRLLKSCILTEINIEDLTTFDVEFLFLELRSKSVGAEVSLMIGCEKCSEKSSVEINLEEDVYVEGKLKDIEMKIPVSNTVGIEMKCPTIDDLDGTSNEPIDMIMSCIKSVYDDKSVYNVSDYTKKELREFVDSLSMKDIQKIQNFFESLPKVKCKTKFKCASCGTDNNFDIEGLSNFF